MGLLADFISRNHLLYILNSEKSINYYRCDLDILSGSGDDTVLINSGQLTGI